MDLGAIPRPVCSAGIPTRPGYSSTRVAAFRRLPCPTCERTTAGTIVVLTGAMMLLASDGTVPSLSVARISQPRGVIMSYSPSAFQNVSFY